MRKSAAAVAPIVKEAVKSVDAQLAEHLEKAEHHLIEAVKLFELTKHPERHPSYVEKLSRAQELVTSLYREELVRIRGPLKVAKRRVGVK